MMRSMEMVVVVKRGLSENGKEIDKYLMVKLSHRWQVFMILYSFCI